MGWTPDPHRASDPDEIFASGRAVAVEAAPGRDHRDLASRHPADDRPPRQQHRGLPSGRGQRSFLRPPRSGFWKPSPQLRGERMADACDASFHGADGFDLVGARANPRGPSGQVSRQARTMTAARYAIGRGGGSSWTGSSGTPASGRASSCGTPGRPARDAPEARIRSSPAAQAIRLRPWACASRRRPTCWPPCAPTRSGGRTATRRSAG